MTLSTGPFHVTATSYVRCILTRWSYRYIAPLSALFLSLVILGAVVNVAFFIVALMYLFIIVPTAMMFVYYYYALNPRIALLSAYDTTIALDTATDSIIATLTPPINEPDDDDENANIKSGERGDADNKGKVDADMRHGATDRPTRQFSIPICDVTDIAPGSPFDIIVYGNKPDHIVLIDKEAFADKTSRIQFHNYIFDKIHQPENYPS